MKFVTLTAALAGALVLSSGSASAAVVCNEAGDCWRTKKTYEYRPEFKLRIHKDDWKWSDADKSKYRWREAGKGRGYWRDGAWIEF